MRDHLCGDVCPPAHWDDKESIIQIADYLILTSKGRVFREYMDNGDIKWKEITNDILKDA